MVHIVIRKSKARLVAKAVFIVGSLFIIYQFVSVLKLSEFLNSEVKATERPNVIENFTCLPSGVVIPIFKVNDDYCDCPIDGSDETATNACLNGKMFCRLTVEHSGYISSGKINDGFCDCCDGTDEVAKDVIVPPAINIDKNVQERLHSFRSPCPVTC